MPRAAVFAVALSFAGPAAPAGELRNWFDDPFFRLTSAVRQCPEPAGPRITEAERRVQAHRRAEKGTTCWLADEQDCQRPNAYRYDHDIAAAIRSAARASAAFSDTSLWVTVQGRVVYVEGCVARESQAREIESFVRSLPHVQQAIAIVTPRGERRPRYKLFVPRRGRVARLQPAGVSSAVQGGNR